MVHRTASEGYATAAEAYVRGRPGYPAAAAAWLRNVIALGPGRTVVEIGAGTGKFLPLLIDTGATVMALEPVAAMRAALAERFGVTIIDGTAERIALAGESVDAVMCAQAFHWFATPQAVAEMRRVLRPGGVLGLIWNRRDAAVPWVAAFDAIVDAHEGDAPRYQNDEWRAVFPAEGLVPLGERRARHDHRGSTEQVIIDRALSTSFIAALPDDRRAAVTAELRALIERTPELAGRSDVAMPYETLMLAFRKVS